MAKSKRTASWTWNHRALGTEGAPLVLADAAAYARWNGNDGEGPADFAELLTIGDVTAVLVDTEGGGPVTVGQAEDEVVVLMCDSDYEDAPKRLAKVLSSIASHALDEHLVGEIDVAEAIVVADGALAEKTESEDRVRLTLPAGRYVVSDGTHENDDGWETRWCRLAPPGRRKYAPRVERVAEDPVATIMARVSFATPEKEACALEDALELTQLGRPDLALELCAKASSSRRALASYTRIIALAGARDRQAAAEAVALAKAWLAPPTSADDVNQALTRARVLQAIDAALAVDQDATLSEHRARVVAAPEPEVFMPDGDTF